MDTDTYRSLTATGQRLLARHRIRGGRIFDAEDWAHEWAVSLWSAESKGTSTRADHITGTTVKRCLSVSQPLRRGPYIPAPISWDPVAHSQVDPSPGPPERAEARDLIIRLLRMCRARGWYLARRLVVRRLHGQRVTRIAKKYGISVYAIHQTLNRMEQSWKAYSAPHRQ